MDSSLGGEKGGTTSFLNPCLGSWQHGGEFWACCPKPEHSLSLPECAPVQEHPLGVCTGMTFPPSMCLCVTDASTRLVGTNRCAHTVCLGPSCPLLTPMHMSPAGRSPPPTEVLGLDALSGCAVLLPAAAQRADVGGEAAGTSINHSQAVLQRLQELLRQGNASDVVLRVQAAGTDEVRVFHAHRLLLGLHSELFRELLSNQSEAVLQEPRDCAAVFDKFIRWDGED